MNEFFNKFDWEKLFESRDVDEMYSLLIEKYFEALGLFLPNRKDETNLPRKKIWWNKDIKNWVKLKSREWSSYKKSGWKSEEKLLNYKIARNTSRHKINRALRDYERSIATRIKSDPRRVYNYINSKKTVVNEIKALRLDDGSLITDRTEMAEEFNTFSQFFEEQ